MSRKDNSQPAELIIDIDDDGRLSAIYDDALVPLLDLGEGTVMRASHVEPDENGMWIPDLSPVGGPRLKPYRKRADALEAEADWLRDNDWSVP